MLRPRLTALASPRLRAAYIVPTRKENVVNVYKTTPRLIPKNTNAVLASEASLMERYDPTGWKQRFISRKEPGSVQPGDIVQVRKKQGTSFLGMVIAINRHNISSTLVLRNKIQGTGVEMIFNIFNPDIIAMDILRNPAVPKTKAKLYYLKGNVKYDVGDLDSEIRKSERKRS